MGVSPPISNWAAGAIAGLTTVMLVLYYGLTRVFLAMSRDGLLPPAFARLNPRTATPVGVILAAGLLPPPQRHGERRVLKPLKPK